MRFSAVSQLIGKQVFVLAQGCLFSPNFIFYPIPHSRVKLFAQIKYSSFFLISTLDFYIIIKITLQSNLWNIFPLTINFSLKDLCVLLFTLFFSINNFFPIASFFQPSSGVPFLEKYTTLY